MSEQAPITPEKKGSTDENDRKFIIDSLSPDFLETNDARSFLFTIDWLEVDEGRDVKVARKQFEDGRVQFLLITKKTGEDGDRQAEPKKELSDSEYHEAIKGSLYHIEKRRFEFMYIQGEQVFSMKYDDFGGAKPNILEVNAATRQERDAFNPVEFPYKVAEVTDDPRFTGYRVALIQSPKEANE